MNLKSAPEREILSFQPHIYKVTSWAILGMLAVHLFFNTQHYLANQLEEIEYFEPIFLFYTLLITLTVRLSLSTHRLTLKFGPFFSYEIQRDQIEKITITPNQRHLLKAKHPILSKKLFSRKPEIDSALDWKLHGDVHFQLHTQVTITNQLNKAPMKKLALQQFSAEQTTDLIKHINQDWGLETPLNTNTEETPNPAIHQDIGQTPLHLVFGTLALGSVFFFIPLEAIHFGVESYLGLIPAGLLAFALSYAVIRAEQKSHPFASALVCSFILGTTLYAVGLQANRWYSEQNPHHSQIYSLKLTATDSRYQTWQLTPELQEKTRLNEIYIHEKWAGFNHSLKIGQSYPIIINEGYFKDFWIQDDAFKQRTLAQGSQL